MNDFGNSSLSLVAAVPIEQRDEDAFLTIAPAEIARLTLSDAIPIWEVIRKQKERLRPRTHEATSGYFAALEKFFGQVRLKNITGGQLREYQIARAANRVEREGCVSHPWKKPAGNSILNHELAALGQVLGYCDLWAKLKPLYTPRKIQGWSPREILTEEEEEHLFRIAFGREDVMLAYCVASITNNTTAAGCELRGLRLRHLFFREAEIDDNGVDQNPSEFYVPPEAVKNESRPRKIPMNPTAKWAFQYCYKRALQLGACKPDHFLFPFRIGPGHYDPERAASRYWIRDNWSKLKTIAGLPNLRPHDMRHLCITRLFENGAAPDDIRALAGHVNSEMTEYYAHNRRRAKLAAVMLIAPRTAVKRKNVPQAVVSSEPKPKKAKPPRVGSSANQDQILSAIAAMMERQTAALEKLANKIPPG